MAIVQIEKQPPRRTMALSLDRRFVTTDVALFFFDVINSFQRNIKAMIDIQLVAPPTVY